MEEAYKRILILKKGKGGPVIDDGIVKDWVVDLKTELEWENTALILIEVEQDLLKKNLGFKNAEMEEISVTLRAKSA